MTTERPDQTAPAADGAPLHLRFSRSLAQVPLQLPEPAAPAASNPVAPPAQPEQPLAAASEAAPAPIAAPAIGAPPPVAAPRPALDTLAAHAITVREELFGEIAQVQTFVQPHAGRWAAGGAAMALAVAGHWLWQRRRQMQASRLQVLQRPLLPAPERMLPPPAGGDTLLPAETLPQEAVRPVPLAGAGLSETSSRREATLIDLHQLDGRLSRRLDKGDTVAAVLVLQQHLLDFRFTSPWVFLELRELYRALGRPQDWEAAREIFRERFGQNAPAWDAPARHDAELAQDAQLVSELVRSWPTGATRLFVLRWMLGEPAMRSKASGPPQLPLGFYRDLILLDAMLDEVRQGNDA